MAEASERLSVAVDVNVFPPDTLFLRMEVGSGKTDDGTPIEITQNADGSMLVRFGDGEWYALSPIALASALYEIHKTRIAARGN
ncbi:MAG: hypothetical protein M0R28_21030 [Pigmentiphaga sp.]|nr:hypothetical protein [Pigmentiphaga sp.]